MKRWTKSEINELISALQPIITKEIPPTGRHFVYIGYAETQYGKILYAVEKEDPGKLQISFQSGTERAQALPVLKGAVNDDCANVFYSEKYTLENVITIELL